MSVTTSTKSFRDMTRAQAIELCYILEEQRDKARAALPVLREDISAEVLADVSEHEPILGVFNGSAGILWCSCMTAREYRAAGFGGGWANYAAHLRALSTAKEATKHE